MGLPQSKESIPFDLSCLPTIKCCNTAGTQVTFYDDVYLSLDLRTSHPNSSPIPKRCRRSCFKLTRNMLDRTNQSTVDNQYR